MPDDVRMYPNLVTPNNPVIFDEEVCTGCNSCVDVCVMDILMPNPEKGKSPIILYPDECWYDGSCVDACPLWQKGAIILNHPLNQRVRWKKKETGEHFRLGMPDPPPPVDKPPSGGWDARA
ncbi:MAG: ferredoxin family protein [Dehalococcoidales bacterium]|nr:MAG: ferredoxin family protein [Dehalococcoidales bacterium]